MLFLTDCGTKLPVQKVGKQIIQTRKKKKKKWGTGFVTLSGSIREEITKKGGKEGTVENLTTACVSPKPRAFGVNLAIKPNAALQLFLDGSIASSLQP